MIANIDWNLVGHIGLGIAVLLIVIAALSTIYPPKPPKFGAGT
jgi:hypothetical protein